MSAYFKPMHYILCNRATFLHTERCHLYASCWCVLLYIYALCNTLCRQIKLFNWVPKLHQLDGGKQISTLMVSYQHRDSRHWRKPDDCKAGQRTCHNYEIVDLRWLRIKSCHVGHDHWPLLGRQDRILKIWFIQIQTESVNKSAPSRDMQGPIPETICLRSAQIRSCDPDRPIAFHKRRSRAAHQIEKIRNQTVYCQLNHDINHSLGNLEWKLRDCDWMKNITLMVSSHDVTMESVATSLWVPIRERHGQFSASTQCLLMIQHGSDMPYLTSMCMWLTSLKIYNLLTQDRPCSSKCFPVVCGLKLWWYYW